MLCQWKFEQKFDKSNDRITLGYQQSSGGYVEGSFWAQMLQVEQDLLLSLAMAAVFQDDFLGQQVAMRGGTALHKVHLAPAARYSEDIDLVLVGERSANHIDRALRRTLDSQIPIW